MTVIGLISDTHGQLPDEALAAMADVDHIIHAGDIGGPEILHALEALAPTTAVLGNNDFDEYGSRVSRFAHPVIDGVRFLVAHYPRDVQIGFNGCAGLAAGDPSRRCASTGTRMFPSWCTDPRRVRHRTSSAPARRSGLAAGFRSARAAC